jgi:hypothetical protein
MRLGGPIVNAPADPDALARAHVTMRYRAAYITRSASGSPRVKRSRF